MANANRQFHVSDTAALHALVQAQPLATLVVAQGGAQHVNHIPLFLDAARGPHGTLVTHLSRGNPQWRHAADGQEVLVIFTGPHAYVSPRWFQTSPAVPTWNYTAVHAYGRARIVEDQARFAEILVTLVEAFEAYDGALYDATGEMTPFDIYADDAEEGDDDGDEEEDDDVDDDLYDADVESDEN